MKVLANIFYMGHVQGVGFRYTTERFALGIHLAGWVKNLSDGRVEIMAEGEKDDIVQLMEKLEARFEGSIEGKEVTYHEAAGKFRNFLITS
jgi:acylphosphatase